MKIGPVVATICGALCLAACRSAPVVVDSPPLSEPARPSRAERDDDRPVDARTELTGPVGSGDSTDVPPSFPERAAHVVVGPDGGNGAGDLGRGELTWVPPALALAGVVGLCLHSHWRRRRPVVATEGRSA